MSGNSRSSCLQTAPIVSAFSLRGRASLLTSVLTAPPSTSACTCPPGARRRSSSSRPGRRGKPRTSGSSSRPRRWRSRTPGSASLLDVRVRRDALAREDVRELLHVGAADHGLALLVLLAEPVHELRTQDVDLAVEDPALVGNFLLLLRELLDELLQLVVRERAEIRERVQCGPFQKRGWATIAFLNLRLRLHASPAHHLAGSGAWPQASLRFPRTARRPPPSRRRRARGPGRSSPARRPTAPASRR